MFHLTHTVNLFNKTLSEERGGGGRNRGGRDEKDASQKVADLFNEQV